MAAQTADLTARLLRDPRTTVVGSAQADLSVEGGWGLTRASVSSVLVQREGPYVATETRQRDEVVLLVSLDTDPAPQWQARRVGHVITFLAVDPEAQDLEQSVLEALGSRQSREIFVDGDSMASGEPGLWLVHPWDHPNDVDDVSPRLDLLAGIARIISAGPSN